jgi:hypothetical protein
MKNLHIYSNIAYLIGAFFLWHVSPLVALACAGLGIASALAHWKEGNWWKGDWIMMYAVFCSIVFNNGALFPLSDSVTASLLLVLFTSLSYLTWKDFYEGYVEVGALFVFSYASYFVNGGDVTQGILGGITLLVSFAIRQWGHGRTHSLDKIKTNATHSMWHVLSMLGIYQITL